jgi:hypothetical protein
MGGLAQGMKYQYVKDDKKASIDGRSRKMTTRVIAGDNRGLHARGVR